ncbi:MAG TPA: PhoH family protein [Firmicutes bacterium]|uniref:PhoH-like protein n=1 Tax=candidate division TA06 bacterium TaxID=2250710 RepID=A0A660SA55_UNCT6|nr:MAG: phosphate starvation-inducible protein PhoH [candidate division TA06 bacterium]HFD04955.1 PhoH family protein [Bacillota bacterium]
MELKIDLNRINKLALLGAGDKNIRYIKKYIPVQIFFRDDTMSISGNETDVINAKSVIDGFIRKVRKGEYLSDEDLKYIVQSVLNDYIEDYSSFSIDTYKKKIKPRSKNQAKYIKAIRNNKIVISIGPAGTGKTYLAVAEAVSSLKQHRISKIILVRPAVEAGESLGYLPGNYEEKILPYLRPLYDAIYDMVPAEKVSTLIDRQIIEISPLAYMRGRTMSDAFVILDEAQNTTQTQMKMFLTRMGMNANLVITGDITQVDLPRTIHSGLIESQDVLTGIPGIQFVYFNEKDVVRHPIVRDIILAYKNYNIKKDDLNEDKE